MRTLSIVALSLAVSLGLAGCSDKTENNAAKTADSAGNDVENAAVATGNAVENAGDATVASAKETGNEMENGRARVEADVQNESVAEAKKD